MVKLDIGCSFHKLDGYLGVDIEPGPDVDVIADLHHLPFADSTINEIHSRHTLEHVKDPHRCISEMYRVCRDSGSIRIIVPHFSNPAYWADMTHLRPFSVRSMEYFDIDFASNSGFPIYLKEINLKTIYARLVWWPKRIYRNKSFLKRTVIAIFNNLFNKLASLNPFICERFWCGFVGGFYEVEFFLKPVKTNRTSEDRFYDTNSKL